MRTGRHDVPSPTEEKYAAAEAAGDSKILRCERHDFLDVFGLREQHHQAVDAEGDTGRLGHGFEFAEELLGSGVGGLCRAAALPRVESGQS